ncbi:sugar transferase [Parahaliea maris]|uniref:Sugar transferase n=1 Tax=Parahaliea maris TaxID=2716870 RepID=A0A5C9A2M5_9GAMM|nr:sugar transferase [Parahaliea maris]TXS94202.1 sugar transferase [Parahaliea maris]
MTSPRQHRCKPIVDLACAAAALVGLSPLLLALGLWVGLGSGRPILYGQMRLGRNGVPFTLYKFRSLQTGTGDSSSIAAEDDARITRPGLLLRRWRLDELPQLYNVLRGDMSLVGPRPLPLKHAAHLPPEALAALQSVRPGITGPAAVDFLAEDAVLAGRDEAESLYLTRLLPEKVRLQLAYLADPSPWRDWPVVWRTLTSVWSGRARQRSAEHIARLLE